MSDEHTSEEKHQALQMRDLIIEKLNTLKGVGSTEHDSGNIFYKFGLNVPTPIILEALGSLADRCHNIRKPFMKPDDIDRYFMGIMRNLCKSEGVRSGLQKWDDELD